MALYWVAYRRDRLLAGAAIVEADSPSQAQTLASVRWSDWNLEFTEGTALKITQAAQLPVNAKGRLLSLIARQLRQRIGGLRTAAPRRNTPLQVFAHSHAKKVGGVRPIWDGPADTRSAASPGSAGPTGRSGRSGLLIIASDRPQVGLGFRHASEPTRFPDKVFGPARLPFASFAPGPHMQRLPAATKSRRPKSYPQVKLSSSMRFVGAMVLKHVRPPSEHGPDLHFAPIPKVGAIP